ncbi:MAG: extracellular solute-binding protein [Planctomycetes bacterium]|nr:extracellular solute-binding protein [Planctomycetota bacterium]
MNTLRRVLVAASFASFSACGSDADVTLYVALDQQHSEQLVRKFEEETGLSVHARYDTEASKTVGLVSAIIEEAQRPRCDVFWNNELAHTVRLGQKGLLTPYESPSAKDIPASFKDPEGRWTGFASRARVFIVNTDLLPDPAERPTSLMDLVDPKWKGRCAVAKPLTGTTLTHFAALRGVLGEAKYAEFVEGLFANEVVFLQSNGATMRETAAGKFAFALTDTDDYHVAKTKGHPVTCVFPDQGEGHMGTMLIPNSIAIVAGGPHPDAAKKLVDWVLSERTEALLAAAKSAQIPVRASVKGPTDPTILSIGAFHALDWDPEATARQLEPTSREFSARFER